MRKNRPSYIVALLTAGLGLSSPMAATAGQSNPLDRVSNKNALHYGDVELTPKEMNPPFVRQGLVVEPDRLKKVRAGLSREDVVSLLGVPLNKGRLRKSVWDYDVRLKMPQSQNYLVCQYKVIFEQQRVRDTVWRRQQCEQLAGNEAPS